MPSPSSPERRPESRTRIHLPRRVTSRTVRPTTRRTNAARERPPSSRVPGGAVAARMFRPVAQRARFRAFVSTSGSSGIVLTYRVVQSSRRSRRTHWIYPVFIILGVSILLYGVVYTVDHVVAKGSVGGGYFSFADDRITDAVGGLSGLFAAILGIIITVVSIIVQLSAERFTHVTQMFLRDKTNLGVLGFYVF